MSDPREPNAPAWIAGPAGGHPSKLGAAGGVHVVPHLDSRPHEWNQTCWCRPTRTLRITRAGVDGGEWIHHAADGRPHEVRHAARLEAVAAHGVPEWDARNGVAVHA